MRHEDQDEITQLRAENAALRADVALLTDRNEPEPGALHYVNCPYRPFADLPSWEEPDNAPECTCSAAHKGAYWKARAMLAIGWRRLAEEKASALALALERIRKAAGEYHKEVGYDEECAAGNCLLCLALTTRGRARRVTRGR